MESCKKQPATAAGSASRSSRGKRLEPRKKQTSDKDRERIVNAYLKGFGAKMISNMLNINIYTVYYILKQYRRTGQVFSAERGGHNAKALSDDVAQSIRQWFEEDSTLRPKQLTQKVLEQYHIRVSPCAVQRELKDLQKKLYKSMQPVSKPNSTIQHKNDSNCNATRKDSLAIKDCLVANESTVFIKQEYGNSSDDDAQLTDHIDIGETQLTYGSGDFKEKFEPSNSAHTGIRRPHGTESGTHHSVTNGATQDYAEYEGEYTEDPLGSSPLHTFPSTTRKKQIQADDSRSVGTNAHTVNNRKPVASNSVARFNINGIKAVVVDGNSVDVPAVGNCTATKKHLHTLSLLR
ncbi:uncharacterized protein LOC120896363 [Anopheles arabiensis]|uniref:uncharacterized protein LOC120896363 n=1 Tax=Anopheles arabiensis TaxID=7173 RepID=UPI001AAE014F|nr:uncharacterized protein LOC120896363 [Anopheles arabiensis]